ncbi:hypothetical protein, partial [Erythrobacter donghaensis]|uniref:hypothetical protein n=1 Tax=Erythrobacter donghaensis TaxID=267135 RepID=UPI000AF57928
RRRIVERTVECQPVGPAGAGQAASLPAGAVQAYYDAAQCPPIAQVAYMPAPLPPLPPISGGGSGAGM